LAFFYERERLILEQNLKILVLIKNNCFMGKINLLLFLFLLAVSSSCFAQNTPTVYTDEASFVTALGSNYFLDEFDDLTLGTQVDSLTRTSGNYRYTIKDGSSTLYFLQLYELNGALSHNGKGAPFSVRNKGKAINAFGGYLRGTDASGAYLEEADTITVGTYKYIFTPSSATSFIGFIFPQAISTFLLNTTDIAYTTLDHFYIGSNLSTTLSPVFDQSSVQLYPNPVREQLSISVGDKALESVVISDLSGKTVMTSKAVSTLNVSNLAKGIYIVQVQTASGVVNKQLIKQ
jgi:hypothetical protein